MTVRCRAWGRVRVRHARLGWVRLRVRFRARARVRVRHARLQRRGQAALEQQVAQVDLGVRVRARVRVKSRR